MQSARRIVTGAAFLVAAAGLAGCNTSSNTSLGAASAVDGNWTSADGVSATRFAGGAFQTTVLATGETVADGTYRMVDGRTVQITMRSAIRQTTSQVNCNLVTPDSLACVGSEGQQFALVRRATG